MRVGLVVALIITIVGGMLNSPPGFGQWVMLSARSFHSADIFAGIIVRGLIGLVSTLLLWQLECWALRWRPQAQS